MRYEHIAVDLSTAACELLQAIIEGNLGFHVEHSTLPVRKELENFANELGARLQRRDQDPNAAVADWIDL